MHRSTLLLRLFALVAILAFATLPSPAQPQISSDLREKVDQLVTEALAKTGVPSASLAMVKNGQIVYVNAYGDARIEPRTAAKPEMRYSIGSISKQFTATAILLLQEQGKL